jgi:hypothetical protein
MINLTNLTPEIQYFRPPVEMMSTQDIIYHAGGIIGLIIYFRNKFCLYCRSHLDPVENVSGR